ncbi:alanine racemase [Dongia deserti]|uniref:alanine racemase n=1 Tax=Dongia deserti TaxID=2268030 RepID=UPI000E659406|nr:alanine racemase [Dongia deserti]
MTVESTAELTIDLGALVANYRLLQRRAKPARAGAGIKANAYGLGAQEAAPALFKAGCREFFVAILSEAIALRPVVPEADIYVLSGPMGGDEAEFVQHRVTPVLNSPQQIDLWSRWCTANGAAPAALHIDTGMSRLGLAPAELDRLIADPALLKAFSIPLVMSHLASADEPGSAQNAQQLARLKGALDRVLPLLPSRPAISFANSSGIFLGRDYAFDLVRPGAALYGLNPTPAAPNPMRQVVGLKARILQVRHIDAHQTVGYGAAHRSTRATSLATLGLGYADGVFRALSHVGAAFVGGIRAPFVGRVSMDLITIDVGHIPPHLAEPGAWVEILGEHQSADDLAAAAGTIGYEVLTALGPRYQRRYIPAG